MKLLLTSAGIKNASIRAALVELLGKPIEEASALFVPTAIYAHPIGVRMSARMIRGEEPRSPMCELGWKSLGLLELTALPSIERDRWEPALRETDVVLVGGGDPLYLHHWMVESGVAEVLAELDETVYVGLSAGSMIMAPRIGEDFVNWRPPGGSGDETLGTVDFAMFPHLDHPDMPGNSTAEAEKWAEAMPGQRAYFMDDETAIRVVGGEVDVVSEGKWRLVEG